MDSFLGGMFHSSEWDHSFDFSAKKIAIIGSGASSVQFLPEVAKLAKEIKYFQRTAPWVLPKPDWKRHYFEKLLCSFVPLVQTGFRYLIYWLLELRLLGFVNKGKGMKMVEWLGIAHINWFIKDRKKRLQATPKYLPGCKRILLSNNYYEALSRSNVEIVTEKIASITEKGVVTDDGCLREADVIIWGTGFKVQELPRGDSNRGEIIGVGGVNIADEWEEKGGPESYLGICCSGFPNLFFLLGPNTGLGHNSVVIMIEAQVNYVVQALVEMRKLGLRELNVKRSVQLEYNIDIQKQFGDTVWASGCNSWYLNDRGKNTALWPGYTFSYIQQTRNFKISDFDTKL